MPPHRGARTRRSLLLLSAVMATAAAVVQAQDHEVAAAALAIVVHLSGSLFPEPFLIQPGLGIHRARASVSAASSEYCRVAFRMNADAFNNLVTRLSPALAPMRRREGTVEPIEQVAIFLDWVAYGPSVRKQLQDWQRSKSTIQKCRSRVCNAIVRFLYPEFVKQPRTLPEIRAGDARYGHFHGAVGALDGTPILVRAPAGKDALYRNRKSQICQNVLFGVDFDLKVIFCAPGAPGSASDGAVFREVQERIRLPPNGFYLGELPAVCNCDGSVPVYLLLECIDVRGYLLRGYCVQPMQVSPFTPNISRLIDARVITSRSSTVPSTADRRVDRSSTTCAIRS